QSATVGRMKFAWLGCMLFGGLLFAGTQDSEFNVNSRYTVETVVVSGDGWSTDLATDQDSRGKISTGLRREIASIIGQKLNTASLDEFAHRLRKEFHARLVEHHVLRGKSPEYVQVIFDIQMRPNRFDLSVPKFLYHAKQGWSGAVEGTATVNHSGFTLGLVSDGDELAERYAGLLARYENTRVGSDRVNLRFQFESYHQQWNRGTVEELSTTAGGNTSGPYRTRQNFEPQLTFTLAKPLKWSVGASFERFQEQFP